VAPLSQNFTFRLNNAFLNSSFVGLVKFGETSSRKLKRIRKGAGLGWPILTILGRFLADSKNRSSAPREAREMKFGPLVVPDWRPLSSKLRPPSPSLAEVIRVSPKISGDRQ
jgi:hypothetical protein